MTHDLEQLQARLESTFSDHALNVAEKSALAEIARTLGRDDLRFLRNRAFDLARGPIAEGSDEAMPSFKWLEQVIRALDTNPGEATIRSAAYFSPGQDCRTAIVEQLTRCRKTLDICVFTISDDRIAEAILAVHRRGVAVRIVTDNDKTADAGNDIARLERAGIAVRQDRSSWHMHHKFALADGRTLLSGSFNWTRSASDYNQENLLVTQEPHLVEAFAREFQRLWQAFA